MEQLEPGFYYHVYNHANGNEILFHNDDNFQYFLKKYSLYISAIADTLAYCLMPNHFHFLIKIKNEEDIIKTFPKFQSLEKLKQSNFLSKQFSNLFSSYTQSYNKMYKRKGSLFIKNFQRKRITSEQYLKQAITYIHLNPLHHDFVKNPERWRYSSYSIFLKSKPTNLNRNEVIELFDDLNNFIAYHNKKTVDIYAQKMVLDF